MGALPDGETGSSGLDRKVVNPTLSEARRANTILAVAVRPRLPFQIGHRPEGPTQVLIVSALRACGPVSVDVPWPYGHG